jgi:hypothetical protein
MGCIIFRRDQRERQAKRYTSHEVTAPRVVGPSGRTTPEKTVENVAYFSAAKNTLSKHHLHHAFHHDHTSKKPRSNTHFFQNTPEKPSKTTEIQPPTTPIFFSETSIFPGSL